MQDNGRGALKVFWYGFSGKLSFIQFDTFQQFSYPNVAPSFVKVRTLVFPTRVRQDNAKGSLKSFY